jgi:hypothetical protein
MFATPEAVARDWFEQVWNDGSEAAIDKFLAVDAKAPKSPCILYAARTGTSSNCWN